MKTLLALFAILTSFAASAQSIEINANGGTANASAILDLKSTTKGFLLPRMTNAQMLAIPSPAQGLLAFCTDCGTNGDYYFYKGSAWVALGSTTVSVSTTVGSVSDNADEKGATITNGVLNLAPANATNPGIVTKTAQTIAGVKTFSNGIVGNVTGNITGNVTGNAATVTTNANLTGVVTSNGNVTSIANGAIGNAMLANGAVATLSGTNTGDNAVNSLYSGLVTNATHTGDVTGATALTIADNAVTTSKILDANVTDAKISSVSATKITGVLPVANGGTGFSTPNFVDLTTAQTIAGAKTFSSDIIVNGITVGKGAGGQVTNTATGYQALNSNISGNYNTAHGYQALYYTTGNFNTADGYQALVNNQTGIDNTAHGYQALFSNWAGSSNTATGKESLFLNSTGVGNTANGIHSLIHNTTGSKNTAIGYLSDVASGDLTNATAIGSLAKVNASNKIQLGDGNINAVQLGTGTNVTLETGLVKITGGTPGEGKVLTSDAAGLASWISPSSSGVDLTTAQTIAGAKTFSSDINVNGITVGIGAAGIGSNTATGYQALYSNTSGGENTANGYQALQLNTTGALNTAIGYKALRNNTTGNWNTAIGYAADVLTGGLINATAIGANAKVNASNKVRIGDALVSVIEGQVAWSYPSDRRLKENIQVNNNLGLNFINKLQPVTYNYISDNTKVRHDGFIAQDIEQIMKDLNLPFSGLKKSNDGMYSLAYSDFVMPLVNAVKEQKTMIDNQQIQIGNQQIQIDELKKMVESMLKK
jgi:trimeric autotransporter adhesin